MKYGDDEVSLRMYVENYVPKIWKENIGRVAYVPYWTRLQYNFMKKNHFPVDIRWYEKEAIKSFFRGQKKEKNNG